MSVKLVGNVRRHLQQTGIDFVSGAVRQNLFSIRVLTHHPLPRERKFRAELRKVEQHVIRRASRPLMLGRDVGELFRLRMGVDDLDLVNPVATGKTWSVWKRKWLSCVSGKRVDLSVTPANRVTLPNL